MPDIVAEVGGDRPGVLEIARTRDAREGRAGDRRHRACADHHERDADPEIGTLIAP
jgi:hypothetical protein